MKLINCGNFGIDGNYICSPTLIGMILFGFMGSIFLTLLIMFLDKKYNIIPKK